VVVVKAGTVEKDGSVVYVLAAPAFIILRARGF
jgi:hypothetical protein